MDVPRFFHRPLRGWLDETPALDLIPMLKCVAETEGSALRRALLGEEAEWGPAEENGARLLEAVTELLQIEWERIILDPNDPETRAEMNRAKREQRKPPKRPIVYPIAHRPHGLAERRLNEFIEAMAEHAKPADRRVVSLEEFNRVIDAM